MNFMLEGKNSAELTNLIGSGNPNMDAIKYIKPEILKNPAIFPDKDGPGEARAAEGSDRPRSAGCATSCGRRSRRRVACAPRQARRGRALSGQ